MQKQKRKNTRELASSREKIEKCTRNDDKRERGERSNCENMVEDS